MPSRRRLYEGGAKILYESPEQGTVIQHFTDQCCPHEGDKSTLVEGKGILSNRISEALMQALNTQGIPNHFIRRINMREQVVRSVEVIPLIVTVHNVITGSLVKSLGLQEGENLTRPLIEYHIKDKEKRYTLVSEEHISCFGWASPQDMDDIYALTARINDYLSGYCAAVGLRLCNVILEFGRITQDENIKVILTDELSPETMRLWDLKTNNHFDLGWEFAPPCEIARCYHEVAQRFGVLPVQDKTCPNTQNSKITSLF